MPRFLFSYRIRDNYVPGSAEATSDWVTFFETIGSQVAEKGNPTFESSQLGNCGPGTRLGGYSFITADDLESAAVLAKGCPTLGLGGGVEVGLITELDQIERD